jgi:hypothetical protein
MSLKKLANNDELGNPVAHFFKSGNVLRKADDCGLIGLKSFLPKSWEKGTRVEYDVWYSFPDNKIHGYVYTDLLTNFIYLRVASEKFASEAMSRAAESKVTEEGERLFLEIAKNCEDKYRLRPSRSAHDFVIFLAGTNILNKVTDWAKVDNAVRQGAKLKCHPLTSAPAYQHLVHKYGDAVIPKKISGHQLLQEAKIVGCCDNSEMGIAALAKGKTVYRFGKQNHWCTYSAIYKSLLHNGQLSAEKLKAILSCKTSGLVPASIDEPQERIQKFFLQYDQEEHLAPKDIGDQMQSVKRAYA